MKEFYKGAIIVFEESFEAAKFDVSLHKDRDGENSLIEVHTDENDERFVRDVLVEYLIKPSLQSEN